MRAILRFSILFLILLTTVSASFAGAIQGVVTDISSGQPVVMAQVSALTYNPQTGDSLFYNTQTAGDGSYSFENVVSSTYNMWCEHPQYFQAAQYRVQVSDNSTPVIIDFQLQPRNGTVNNLFSGHVYSTPPMLPVFIPLPGATVSLSGNGLSFATFSDSNGVYAFENIMPGHYSVSASAPGHYPLNGTRLVFIGENTFITDFNINLIPIDSSGTSGTLSGLVINEGINTPSYPIYPAYIKLFGVNTDPVDSLIYFAETDSTGSYLIENIVPGNYFATCTAPGFEPQHVPNLQIYPGFNSFTFLLMPSEPPARNSVSGKVYNLLSMGPIEAPIYHASVTMISLAMDSVQWMYQEFTGHHGRYLFTNIIPGYYEIQARAAGFEPSQKDTIQVFENSHITGQDFGLVPSHAGDLITLTGTVYDGNDPAGGIVHPAEIFLMGYSSSNTDSLIYFTVNLPNGEYRIDNIQPGVYNMWCSAPGYETYFEHHVQLFDSLIVKNFYLLPVVVPEKGWISGQVIFDQSNLPVEGAFIDFISRNVFDNFHVRTDATGHYLAPLHPGTYYVSCLFAVPDSMYHYQEYYDNVHSLSQATPVTVTSHDTTANINFGIPQTPMVGAFAVSGKVTDLMQNPLGNATVKVWMLNIAATPVWDSTMVTGTTDSLGNYFIQVLLFRPVPWICLIVSAEKPGYAPEFYQEKQFPFEADLLCAYTDTTFSNINFTLQPVNQFNSIRGTVSSENGSLLSQAFIIAANANNGQIVFTFSNNLGEYTLGGLQAGYYYILFTADGHVPEFYDNVYFWENATPVFAQNAVTGIDASLTPIMADSSIGTVAGTVANSLNQPLTGVLVFARNALGDVIGYDITDGAGMYEIPGLNGGAYQVLASKVSYGSETQDLDFNAEIANYVLVDFTLEEAASTIPGDNAPVIPTELRLLQNYPNPFNPSTQIGFELPEAVHVQLVIYNILGQAIRVLISDNLEAGTYTLEWNGKDGKGKPVASGIYFYSLETEKTKLVNKLILNR